MSSSTIYSLFALCFVLLCVGFSSAQLVRSTNPAALASSAAINSNSERVTEFTVTANKALVSWTAFGREWRVRLTLSDIVEDNEDYFYGTLEGDETAAVSFALLPGKGLSGMLLTREGTFLITAQAVTERNFSEREEDLVIFMSREVSDEQRGAMPAALQEPLHPEDEEADDHANERRATTTVNTYKVAVYVDPKWALASNNPWASQADTIALLNDVNAVYRAAGLKTFTVTYQKQVSNPKSNVNDILKYFSDSLSKSLSAFKDKSFTNLLLLVGDNLGGLAYVGTTCKGSTQNSNRKTAVAGLVNFSRLYTVKTIAHELAHNRGANHQFTNQCSGNTKTGCQCSVMSYCFPTATNNPDGAKNFFSTFSINEMHKAGCY